VSAKHATEQLHRLTLRRLAREGERAPGGIDGSTATLGPNMNKPTESQLERAHGPEQPFRVGRASQISTGPGSQTLSRPGQLDSLRAVIRATNQGRAAGGSRQSSSSRRSLSPDSRTSHLTVSAHHSGGSPTAGN
jgi:hypothetical protein